MSALRRHSGIVLFETESNGDACFEVIDMEDGRFWVAGKSAPRLAVVGAYVTRAELAEFVNALGDEFGFFEGEAGAL